MNMAIPAHRIKATLLQDGTLTLQHLPLRAGQCVEVIIVPQPDEARAADLYPLHGTTFRYDRPTEPVAEEDWDALR